MGIPNRYRGKAFVIGVDHYDQVKPDLNNAVNDAKGIYEALQGLGFMMMDPFYDKTIYEFDPVFNIFLSDLDKYDVGVLYFSGHGVEINGKNYLLMKDTPMTDVSDSTERYSIDLQKSLIKLHDTGCKMIIVIIDACRNNPFEGKQRGWGSVNLAPVFAPKGTMIAYSTSPGEKADDYGMNGHSVYTGALLSHLKEEGLEVEMLFKKVRATVNAMTGGKKTSWEHTSLIGSFAFNSGRMMHVDDLEYDKSALCDKDFASNDNQINALIKGFKSYNYYTQNSTLASFQRLEPSSIDKNTMFVIGRNILQSASGGAFDCQDFIKDCNALARYTIKGENHLLNGILFEMYFNSMGQFRYKNFKLCCLDELLQFSKDEKLQSSFIFINGVLNNFSSFLMFIPNVENTAVDINVKSELTEIEMPWGKQAVHQVKSVTFEGYELIAGEEEINTFPSYHITDISTDGFSNLLSESYAIPTSMLRMVYNEDMSNGGLWLDVKFKRNFRVIGVEDKEEDDLDALLEGV